MKVFVLSREANNRLQWDHAVHAVFSTEEQALAEKARLENKNVRYEVEAFELQNVQPLDEAEENPFHPESPEGRAWDRGVRELGVQGI